MSKLEKMSPKRCDKARQKAPKYDNFQQIFSKFSAKKMTTSKSSLIVDTRRPLKDGTYPIKIKAGYGTNLYLSTGFSVKLDNPNDKNCQLMSLLDRSQIRTLMAMVTGVECRINELRSSGKLESLSAKQAKEFLTNFDVAITDIEASSKNSVGKMFERVIATKSKRNAEIYQATFDKLKAYCDIYSLKFEDVTKMWLMEFQTKHSHLAVNTIAIHLRNLRNVFNFAIDEEITHNYPFRNFRIKHEETEKRSLPIESLRYFINAKHLDETYSEYRDIFVLMFYLLGINIVDLSRLTNENLVNGRIEYRRAKTGKLYSIKLEPEAIAIINKHKGEKHLLKCFDRYSNYRDYTKHLNTALRKIGPLRPIPEANRKRGVPTMKMEPMESKITTYWARYSWATCASDLDIPKDTISEALGHEYGSRITGIYIKFNRNKVDEANRRVIDYVLGK